MTLSKKHYIRVAKIIKSADNLQEAKLSLAYYFAEDNPHFDTNKFIEACKKD